MTLLRRARVLASRLSNQDFVAWIRNELDGYPADAELPKYRVLSVDARAHLIIGMYQLQRASVMASQIPEKFRVWATTTFFRGSVSEIASLVAADKGKSSLQCPWPQEIALHYGGAGYGDGRSAVQCLRAWQEISVASLVGVIETVRNRLLEFVLQIEAEAPDAGEASPGKPALPPEKVNQIFNTYVSGGVTHIAGTDASRTSNTSSVGSMTNSQIQQAGAESTQTVTFSRGTKERSDLERLAREMSDHIADLALDADARRKAEAQIRTLQAQLTDDEPEALIVSKAGSTLRNVTEGAIGSLIASAVQPTVWHWVAQILPTLFQTEPASERDPCRFARLELSHA
jgi:hypothetical protein